MKPLGKQLVFMILILGVSILSGFPTLSYDFFADDYILIVENPDVQSLKKIPNLYTQDFFQKPIVGLKTKSTIGYYRPFTKTTFALDWSIWGRNAKGFHLTNILLYALISIFIFFLMLELGISQGMSFVLVMIFSVFPTHDQVLTLINARSDLLCAIGLIMVCLGSFRGSKFLLICGSIIAPFSKEPGMFVPVLAFLTSWVQKKSLRACARSAFIPIGIVGLYLGLRTLALGNYLPDTNTSGAISTVDQFILIGKLLQTVCFSMFGISLSRFSMVLIPTSPWNFWVIFGWLCFSGFTMWFVVSAVQKKKISIPLMWVLLGFLPMLAVKRLTMPVDNIIPSMNRWSFMSSIGLLISLGLILQAKHYRKKYLYWMLPVILLLLLTLWSRVSVYSNDKSFGQEMLRIYQQKPYDQLPKNLLVRRLDMEAIALSEEKKYGEAVGYFLKALEIDPDDKVVCSNLGTTYLLAGDFPNAIIFLKKSLTPKKISQENKAIMFEVKDGDARGRPPRYFLLSEAYQKAGKIAESESAIRKAVEGDPANVSYLNNLAVLMAMQGRLDEAKVVFISILERDMCHLLARNGLRRIQAMTHDRDLETLLEQKDKACSPK